MNRTEAGRQVAPHRHSDPYGWQVSNGRGQRVAGPFRSYPDACTWSRFIDREATADKPRPFRVRACP